MTNHVWKKTTANPIQKRTYFRCGACGARAGIESYRESPNNRDLEAPMNQMTCTEVAIYKVMET